MKKLHVSDPTKCASPSRPSFKPLLEDALQVLKDLLHNPEADDFKKIIFAMKNCSFFRETFTSQAVLNEFVEVAKFYVGYEVHQYGTVLLHDKEYADKLCIILDGSVEKIFQKPYRDVEEQLKEKRKVVSCSGLDLSPPLKSKIQLPSLKSSRVLDNSLQSTEGSLTSLTVFRKPRASSIVVQPIRKPQRHASQKPDLRLPTLEEETLTKPLPIFGDLMKFIVNKKPEMKSKYYTEDILRAEQVKTLVTGDYFGESFCMQNHPKSNHMYAVSSPEAHVLTLNKEDYHEVLNQLEDRNYKKLEAFIKLFPPFKREQIQRFSEYFSQKNFQADEVIYPQGASAQDFYIVQSGEIQLLQKSIDSRGGSFVPITSVIKDQAFGEESLLMMDRRQESAIAKVSNTTVFVLKASLIADVEREFKDFISELRKGAEEKFQWRLEKAKELFEKNENNSAPTLDYSPQFKNIKKSLFNPRHSIEIPNRRSFIVEKNPVQPNSATHLPSSLASIFSRGSPRRLSDDPVPQQAQRNELYKSKFGRTNVISDIGKIARAGEKANFFQPANFSPGSDLQDLNFRNELYGGKNSKKNIPGKISQDAQQKIKTVSPKLTKNQQARFKIMILKRGAN